jgi:putative phosphonate metabolism protein
MGCFMEQMKRYAIYYAPRAGAFATAAAAWLGWDLQTGRKVVQPALTLPRPLADLTAEPRKYGFHGTLKAPFRLGLGVELADLQHGIKTLASQLAPVEMSGLTLHNLHGFLALVPQGDPADLLDLGAEVVRFLDPYRAALSDAEYARRRPEALTERQRELLGAYGYPFVMEEFQFHLTLSGPVTEPEVEAMQPAALAHFAGLIPQPFAVEDLCLCGEDHAGRFHLLNRYPLSA